VTEHVVLCETVVEDLNDCYFTCQEEIQALKLLGIESEKDFTHNEEAVAIFEDYRNRQLVKLDQEPKVKQKCIPTAKPGRLAIDQSDSTNGITTQLQAIHSSLKTFTNMMEENMT
jgi:hypothetical protein